MPKFSIIAAVEKNFGIGKEGKIPWHLPSDLKYFNRITKGNLKNVVIMGRATWDSLPSEHRPLKDRINIIISRNPDYVLPHGSMLAQSLDDALEAASAQNPEEIFVIGGAQIYREAVNHPEAQKIYLTEIDAEFECDAFFPKFDTNKFKKVQEPDFLEENGLRFRFSVFSL